MTMIVPALLLAVTAYALVLLYSSMGQAERPLARPVSTLFAGLAVASFGFSLMLLSEERGAMLFWNFIDHVGFALLLIALGWLLYSYVTGGSPLGRRGAALLLAVPVAMLVMVATDPWHGLYFSAMEEAAFLSYSYLDIGPSYGFIAVVIYALALLSGILYLIFRTLTGAIEANLRHMATLAVAMVSAMGVSAITSPVYSVPQTLIETLVIAAVAYPIYRVTFGKGFKLWSLSFKDVLDISTDIKLIVSDQGSILYSNHMARRVLDLSEGVPADIEDALSAGNGDDVKELSIDVDGEHRVFSFESLPLYTRRGSCYGTMVTMKDVTDEAMLRKALADANEKIRLMSSISRHDMLNQLSVVTGSVYVLEERTEGDAKAKRLLDSVNRAADAIHRQLMFMRDYEMLGASDPEWIPLRSAIEDVLRDHEMEGVSAEVDVGEHEVLADPLVNKVFYNLVHNSLVHGEGLGAISFRAVRADGALEIHYRDDGGGVDPRFREQLFDKGVGRNSGLGLFLSRSILESTGMSIDERGAHGEGVHFVIAVPEGKHREKGGQHPA